MNDPGDLGAWLARHGLGARRELLEARGLDLAGLGSLGAEELRGLGLSLGDRLRLERALAADPPTRRPAPEAERRQATLGFCDIGGADGLDGLDAEDLGLAVQSFHACCREIAERWGGRIVNAMTDSVLFAFGYPVAHEDAAERAARAALEMVEAIGRLRLTSGGAPAARIGIETGRVVARATSDDEPDELTLTGETLNRAKRTQEAAPPGAVVVAEGAERLLRGRFRLTPMGDQLMRGFAAPAPVWRVDGPLPRAQRFAADLAASAPRLIGRSPELDALTARWRRALEGAGQVALVSGEAGIGKSRLLRALSREIAGDAPMELRFFCTSYARNTALHPVASHLRAAAGIGPTDGPAERRRRIDRAFEAMAAIGPHALDLVASLLDSAEDGGDALRDFTSTQRKSALIDLLARNVARLSQWRPVLVVFEDLHWCDPSSLELLERLVRDVTPSHRVMLAASHRPEFAPPWSACDGAEEVRLIRLPRFMSENLVAAMSGDAALPAAVVDEIVDKADGVPLFLEELTRATLEARARPGAAAVAAAEVPATLADSLMSRLDRLPRGRSAAQVAAVIGRAFDRKLLGRVAGLEEAELTRALEELETAGIAAPLRAGADSGHVFKHALIQEAAYDSLLRRRRLALHLRVAESLRDDFPEIARREPERVALHFARAEAPEPAIRFLLDAGRRALGQAAQAEAIHHFHAAIELVEGLPDGEARTRREIELRALLGGALIAAKGYAAPEVHETFLKAHELCRSTPDEPLLATVLYGLWVYNLARSDRDETAAFARRLRERFGASSDPVERIAAAFANGITSFYSGRLEAAEADFAEVFAHYEPALNARLVEGFGDDLGQFALAQSAWLETLRGDFAAAERHEARAFELAETLGDAMSATRACVFAMLCRHDRGDAGAAARFAGRAVALASEKVFPFWLALGRCGRGWALAREGETAGGLAEIREGLGFFPLIGQKLPLTYWSAYEVEALALAGEPERALAAVDAALRLSARNLDRFHESELLGLKAGILASLGRAEDEVAALLDDADRIAAEMGAALLRARAAARRDAIAAAAAGGPSAILRAAVAGGDAA